MMKKIFTRLCLMTGLLVTPGLLFAADSVQYIKPSVLTTAFVIIYIIISIGIGIYATKLAKTPEQFFGGTKSFGPALSRCP